MKRLIGQALEQSVGLGDLTRDAWGVPKVSMPYSLFHGLWTYDIPPSMWFMYEGGTQVYTSTNIVSTGGYASLTADATASPVLLESRECPRYEPNRGHLFSTALWCPDATADGVRDFGLFTAENGVFFRLKADGLLYAVLRRGGVEVIEDAIDTSILTGFDVTKNNIYDIQFQWRGAGNYHFYIGDPGAGVSRLVHSFDLLGTLTTVSLENPALPVAYKCTRTTEDVVMNVGCADITSENGTMDRHQYASATASNVAVNGTDVPVITFHQPLQINGTTNTRTSQLARIDVTCSKKAVFTFWTTRDPTAFTGMTLAEKDTPGVYVETDNPGESTGAVAATAVDTAKLEKVLTIPVEAAVQIRVDNPLREKIHFPLVRGDYLVVTVTVASATADVSIEWGEQI